MTIYGFTGTRNGLNSYQIDEIRLILKPGDIVHHGDCIGSDAEFHRICLEMNLNIIIHPPINNKSRAYCISNKFSNNINNNIVNNNNIKTLNPYPHLVRNKNIVNACNILIACPFTTEEELHSET